MSTRIALSNSFRKGMFKEKNATFQKHANDMKRRKKIKPQNQKPKTKNFAERLKGHSLTFQFMNFLERLGRALNADEIAKDVGVDLHTESLLIRAEQLARLETDKIVDKVSFVNLLLSSALLLSCYVW